MRITISAYYNQAYGHKIFVPLQRHFFDVSAAASSVTRGKTHQSAVLV
jgi:hypothetical protein